VVGRLETCYTSKEQELFNIIWKDVKNMLKNFSFWSPFFAETENHTLYIFLSHSSVVCLQYRAKTLLSGPSERNENQTQDVVFPLFMGVILKIRNTAIRYGDRKS